MNHHTRMALTLVFSLLVSAQNFKMAAMGEADFVDVGLRYVAAFLIGFVFFGVFGNVVNSYIVAVEARRAEADAPSDDLGDALAGDLGGSTA